MYKITVLKQYWEYRISRAKTINIDFISQNILSLLSEHYKDCDISTRLYVCIYRDYQHLNYWRTCPCSIIISYILIKKILKILYWGRNLQGRTGKGPKPLGAEPEKGRNLWHSNYLWINMQKHFLYVLLFIPNKRLIKPHSPDLILYQTEFIVSIDLLL